MAKEALRKLITLDGDYVKLVGEARNYLRCTQTPQGEGSVLVSLADIDRALRLYEEGVLSEEQVVEWAEILEMNGHVRYETGEEGTVADLLFQLSTPEINEPISSRMAHRLRASLARARGYE